MKIIEGDPDPPLPRSSPDSGVLSPGAGLALGDFSRVFAALESLESASPSHECTTDTADSKEDNVVVADDPSNDSPPLLGSNIRFQLELLWAKSHRQAGSGSPSLVSLSPNPSDRELSSPGNAGRVVESPQSSPPAPSGQPVEREKKSAGARSRHRAGRSISGKEKKAKRQYTKAHVTIQDQFLASALASSSIPLHNDLATGTLTWLADDKITSYSDWLIRQYMLVNPTGARSSSLPPQTALHTDHAQPSLTDQKRRLLWDTLVPEIHLDRQREKSLPKLQGNAHIFVDLSNILINFRQTVAARGGLIGRTYRIHLSYDRLHLILERARLTSKKVCSASIPDKESPWPVYLKEAERLGYEMKVHERVPKKAELRGNGYGSSSAETADEAKPGNQMREYAVDEVLQLQMMYSIFDSVPGILVLATGDANVGEFGKGFRYVVDQALKHGWTVELVSWRRSMSSLWSDPTWMQSLAQKNNFRIITLDPYVECLLEG